MSSQPLSFLTVSDLINLLQTMDQKAWVVVKGRHDITGICLEDVKTKHAVTCGGDEKHFESISVLVDDESSAEKLHQQFVTEKYEQIQKRKVVSIFAPH